MFEYKLAQQGFNGFEEVYLINGVGKRAVKVILVARNAHRPHSWNGLMDLLLSAAKRASKRGWKKIWVVDDAGTGNPNYMFALNTAMFDRFLKTDMRPKGTFLGFVSPITFRPVGE